MGIPSRDNINELFFAHSLKNWEFVWYQIIAWPRVNKRKPISMFLFMISIYVFLYEGVVSKLVVKPSFENLF